MLLTYTFAKNKNNYIPQRSTASPTTKEIPQGDQKRSPTVSKEAPQLT